jgi:hypothetical protein
MLINLFKTFLKVTRLISNIIFFNFSLDQFQLFFFIFYKISMVIIMVIELAFYFLEPIYIQLSNKRRKVVMFKIFTQNIF